MAEKTGNMFYRGDWKVCCEYNVGDVVQRAGALYMAMEQSAGMDPLDPLNAKYWKLTFAPIVPPTTKHNELEGLQGGDAAKDEFYHLTKDQAEAAVHLGVGGAGRVLQSTLNRILGDGAVTVDGSGGPKTMEALKPCLTKPENVRAVCLTLLDVRKAYFLRIVERDEKQGKFLKGWMNRLKKLRGYVDEAA